MTNSAIEKRTRDESIASIPIRVAVKLLRHQVRFRLMRAAWWDKKIGDEDFLETCRDMARTHHDELLALGFITTETRHEDLIEACAQQALHLNKTILPCLTAHAKPFGEGVVNYSAQFLSRTTGEQETIQMELCPRQKQVMFDYSAEVRARG